MPRSDPCQEGESCREFPGTGVRASSKSCASSVGFFEMKMKYDESDNVLIRASRALTDKVTDVLGECGFRSFLSAVAAARGGR